MNYCLGTENAYTTSLSLRGYVRCGTALTLCSPIPALLCIRGLQFRGNNTAALLGVVVNFRRWGPSQTRPGLRMGFPDGMMATAKINV